MIKNYLLVRSDCFDKAHLTLTQTFMHRGFVFSLGLHSFPPTAKPRGATQPVKDRSALVSHSPCHIPGGRPGSTPGFRAPKHPVGQPGRSDFLALRGEDPLPGPGPALLARCRPLGCSARSRAARARACPGSDLGSHRLLTLPPQGQTGPHPLLCAGHRSTVMRGPRGPGPASALCS